MKNPDLLRAYLAVCWLISKTDGSTQIFAREEFQRLNRGVGAAKPKVPIAGRLPLSVATKAHDPPKGLILGRSCSKSDRGELLLWEANVRLARLTMERLTMFAKSAQPYPTHCESDWL